MSCKVLYALWPRMLSANQTTGFFDQWFFLNLGLFFLIFFETTFWIPSGPIYVCLNLSWSLQDVCILIFALWIAFNMKKRQRHLKPRKWSGNDLHSIIWDAEFFYQRDFLINGKIVWVFSLYTFHRKGETKKPLMGGLGQACKRIFNFG